MPIEGYGKGSPVVPPVDSDTPLNPTENPRRLSPQNFTNDSSNAKNKSCLAKFWDAIRRFFTSICSCLCRRSKEEIKPVPTPKGNGKAEDGNPPEESSLSKETSEAVSLFLDGPDPVKRFREECDSICRKIILLYLANEEGPAFSRVTTYLRPWVQVDPTNLVLLQVALGIKEVDDVNEKEHRRKLISFLKAQLESSDVLLQPPAPLPQASGQTEDQPMPLKVKEFLDEWKREGRIMGLLYFEDVCDKKGKKEILIYLAKNLIDDKESLKQIQDCLYRWQDVDRIEDQVICQGVGVSFIHEIAYTNKNALITFLEKQ